MTREQRIAALELEFQRLKDRQDVMAAQLAGDQDAWLHLTVNLPETVAEVTVDKAVSESRQGAVAMAGILKALEALAGEREVRQPVADPADEVARRREDKLAAARAAGQ